MSDKITLKLTRAELAIITTLLNQSDEAVKAALSLNKTGLTPVEKVLYSQGTQEVWETLSTICEINHIDWQKGTYAPPRPTPVKLF